MGMKNCANFHHFLNSIWWNFHNFIEFYDKYYNPKSLR